MGAIFQCWQLFRKGPRADLISTHRYGHRQRFMRSDVIVAVTPFIEPTLHPLKVAKTPAGQYFYFQAAVKAFIFALGLRMIRSTVTDSNAEPQQPYTSMACIDVPDRFPKAPRYPSTSAPANHNDEKWPSNGPARSRSAHCGKLAGSNEYRE